MKTYNVAPMDLAIRIVTVSIYLLIAGIAIWGVVQPAARDVFWVVLGLAFILWISWQIAPKRYDLTDDALVIMRGWPFRDISIPIAEIRDIRPVKISALTTLRTFGVGGLFSASGWFWNKEIGSFFGEITSIGRTVLIDAGKKYVISPDDRDQFVADIRR